MHVSLDRIPSEFKGISSQVNSVQVNNVQDGNWLEVIIM